VPMKIHRDGLTFWGSLITGPTCNFLKAEFVTHPVECVEVLPIQGAENGEIDQILGDVLNDCAGRLPTGNDLYLDQLRYDATDTPSKAHYARLLHLILEAMEQ